jgi:hypothetical protein
LAEAKTCQRPLQFTSIVHTRFREAITFHKHISQNKTKQNKTKQNKAVETKEKIDALDQAKHQAA